MKDTEYICSVCQTHFASRHSLKGACKSCGKPICYRCWLRGVQECSAGCLPMIIEIPKPEQRPVEMKAAESPQTPPMKLKREPGIPVAAPKMFQWPGVRWPFSAKTEKTGSESDSTKTLDLTSACFPISARDTARKQNLPIKQVVESFQQRAKSQSGIYVCQDPQRRDWLLDCN